MKSSTFRRLGVCSVAVVVTFALAAGSASAHTKWRHRPIVKPPVTVTLPPITIEPPIVCIKAPCLPPSTVKPPVTIKPPVTVTLPPIYCIQATTDVAVTCPSCPTPISKPREVTAQVMCPVIATDTEPIASKAVKVEIGTACVMTRDTSVGCDN